MSVIKGTVYALALILMTSCSAIPDSQYPSKPYSSLFGTSAACSLGEICDYTGEFKRHSSPNKTGQDALYTYDDNDECVLIIADKAGLKSYETERISTDNINSEISISGQAVLRSTLPYWSNSLFCNDTNIALILQEVNAVLVMYH